MRVELALKTLLLLALGALFAAFMWTGLSDGTRHPLVRLAAVLLSAPFAAFCFWSAALGLADTLLGATREVQGAVALRSRRWGNSLKLPDGRFAEFVLFNPGPALEPDRRYTLVIGRWSRVIVAPPRPET